MKRIKNLMKTVFVFVLILGMAMCQTEVSSLAYTVEFTHDGYQYVLPGDSEEALSEILDTVGLTGEVSDVEVSDESLFSAKKCKTAEDGNTPEKDEDGKVIEDENGTWFVFAHQAFSTEEWMKVTIGGVMYEIMVTDSVSNNVSYIDADGSPKTSGSVDVVDESMDDNAGSFGSGSGWLYVNDDVTLNGASNTGNVAQKLILGDGKTLTLNNAGLGFNYAPLTIYGQSEQTGSLTVNRYLSVGTEDLTVNGGKVAAISNISGEAAISAKNVTINRGTVTATTSKGGTPAVSGGVTLNGGMLTATATGSNSTAINGGVTLNGGMLKATGKSTAVRDTVKVAEGKLYKDDADPCNYYFGTLSNAQKAAINGKTLSPVNEAIHAVAISGVTRGTVTADKYTVATDATGEARTVTLTLAPETGYSLKTLTVKDTSGDEVAVSGEGDTRTFTMPNDHVTVSVVFALSTGSTAYIDENGTEQAANAVALTGGGATTLDGGWYVVPENTTVSYTGTLKFNGNTHLILADDATLNCGTESGRINVRSIEVDNGGLTVYGQSDQTGRLNAYNNNANTIFSQNSAAFNGGTVTADSVGSCAIMSSYSVTVRRGTVNAVSSAGQNTSDHTINAIEGVIVAGGALNVTAPDGKYAVKVSLESRGVTLAGGTLNTTGGTGVVGHYDGPATVKVAEGMNYTDGTNLYRGTLTDGQKAAIHGTTLTPAYGVIAAEGIEHGTVSASPAAFAIKDFADADKTVTLTVTPDENYTIGTVSYNDGSDHTITPVNGVYSFTMPEKDVTVNATFLKSLSHSDITIGSIAEQTYQGSGTTPSVTIKDGDTTLTEGEDYTLSYSNNINVSESTAANAPTVTVTGKGNYSGMKTATFTIKPRSVGIKAEAQSVELNGEIATGTDKVEVSSGEIVSGHSIYRVTVATENTRNAVGTFDGAITASGALIRDANGNDVTANYNITYTAGTLTVMKVRAKVTTVPTAKTGLIYTGGSQTLLNAGGSADTAMEYAFGSNADTAPVSGYSETVPGGTDAKTYYIWYRAKSDENHEAGDPAVLTVEIAKATPNITTVPTAAAITYGQTLNESTLTGGAATLNETDVNGDFTWSDTSISPAVSDSNKTEYTVKFTPTDAINYNAVTCKVKIAVKKAEISQENITAPILKEDLKYTGSAQELITAGYVSGDVGTMHYAVTTENTAPADESFYTTSIPTETNAGNYYVWYKVVGDANHNSIEPQSVQVSVAKAAYPEQSITAKAMSGESGLVDLSKMIAPGGVLGDVTVKSGSEILDGTPALSDGRLQFTFKSGVAAGQSAGVEVKVNNSSNYNDYTIKITLGVTDKLVPLVSASPITVTYSGAPVDALKIKGTATVLEGSTTVSIPGSWTFADGQGLTDVRDSGGKKVIFTPGDTSKYETVETVLELTVNKAAISGAPAFTKVTSSGKKLADANLSVGSLSVKDGTLSWNDGADTVIVQGRPYGWTFIPNSGNYEIKTGTAILWEIPSGGGSGSGGSGGSGSGSGGSGSGNSGTPAASPAPGASPAPSAAPGTSSAPTIVEQQTETTKNPDGSTTTTTTTTDSEGTKTTESETVKADGTVEKSTETIKADGSTEKSTEAVKADGTTEKQTEIVSADGSTEKITETTKPNGASEKVTDIAKANGATIHEEVKTTAKGKETSQKIETSASGSVKIIEQVKQPSGDHSKVVMNKTGKKTVAIKQATTTAKNGKVSIPKTVNANGEKLKVTALKKNFLKGSETKPKEITINASNITKVAKGAFDYINKKAVIKIVADKKDYKRIQKLIKKSGVGNGVKIKRVK